MKIYNTVILGAGVAGIGAAYGARIAKEKNIVLFEQDKTWGGLCGSFEIDGFTFDKAVHLSFSDIETVQKIFYETEYLKHEPEAKNYADGFWIRHPIQNNCYALPIEERIKIIKSFTDRSDVIRRLLFRKLS